MLRFKAMRHASLLLLTAILVLLSGCVDTGRGTILGALTYFRVEGAPAILVRDGFVALYLESADTAPVEVRQADELGRFNFEVDEGQWAVAGALTQAGPFTGVTGPFAVRGNATTRVIFAIEEPAPNAPIAGEVQPTGAVGVTGAEVTFQVSSFVEVTGWLWDFGEAAVPQFSTEERPTVTLGTPGEYTAAVMVWNEQGTSRPRPFDITIAPLDSGEEEEDE